MNARKSFGHTIGAFWALALVGTIGLAAAPVVAGCAADGKLTQPAETGILAGEVALCDAVLGAEFPAGVAACPGQGALLKLALDKVSDPADAGPSPAAVTAGNVTSGVVAAVLASNGVPARPIKTTRGYAVFLGTRCLGYVPLAATAAAIHAPAVQAYLTSAAPIVAYLAPAASSSASSKPAAAATIAPLPAAPAALLARVGDAGTR